nr:MAG TPA: hypothetical protein [Caudoviricetes sp.]
MARKIFTLPHRLPLSKNLIFSLTQKSLNRHCYFADLKNMLN